MLKTLLPAPENPYKTGFCRASLTPGEDHKQPVVTDIRYSKNISGGQYAPQQSQGIPR